MKIIWGNKGIFYCKSETQMRFSPLMQLICNAIVYNARFLKKATIILLGSYLCLACIFLLDKFAAYWDNNFCFYFGSGTWKLILAIVKLLELKTMQGKRRYQWSKRCKSWFDFAHSTVLPPPHSFNLFSELQLQSCDAWVLINDVFLFVSLYLKNQIGYFWRNAVSFTTFSVFF